MGILIVSVLEAGHSARDAVAAQISAFFLFVLPGGLLFNDASRFPWWDVL